MLRFLGVFKEGSMKNFVFCPFSLVISSLFGSMIHAANHEPNLLLSPAMLNTQESENLKKQIELLDLEISRWPNESKTLSLRNERGILFFMSGQHEKAIDDFNCVLEKPHVSIETESYDIGVALWGRALANAMLGKEIELKDDLDHIAELITLCEGCGRFSGLKIINYDQSVNSHGFYLVSRSDEELENNVAFCTETVRNTVRFMK